MKTVNTTSNVAQTAETANWIRILTEAKVDKLYCNILKDTNGVKRKNTLLELDMITTKLQA